MLLASFLVSLKVASAPVSSGCYPNCKSITLHGSLLSRPITNYHTSYRRQELGFRTNIYVSAASASGAFGGLLAIGLSKIPHWGLIHTWRNVYFFEVRYLITEFS
jgi:hypothetical protein